MKEFEEFYKDHYNLACSIVRKFVNHNDVEDVVQEAMFRAWRYFDTIEDKRKMFFWAYSIFRNTAINYAKSQSIRTLSKAEEITEDVGYEEEFYDWLDDVRKALEHVDEDVKTVTMLKIEGYTNKHICERLGITRKEFYDLYDEGRNWIIQNML